MGDELRPASRAAQPAGGSVDRVRNRAARAEGHTAAACHTARGISEANRAYGHYSYTRTDAADSSLATLPPVSSRVSHTGTRVSRTSTRLTRTTDAQPADLASANVDSLNSPAGRHPQLARSEIADRDVHTVGLGPRRPKPQPHRTPGNASEHQSAPNANNRSDRTDKGARHQRHQPRAGPRDHTRARRKPTLSAASRSGRPTSVYPH